MNLRNNPISRRELRRRETELIKDWARRQNRKRLNNLICTLDQCAADGVELKLPIELLREIYILASHALALTVTELDEEIEGPLN